MKEEQIGVYSIVTNSNKIYVGMTCDSFKARWMSHKKELLNGRHKCTGLKNSVKKHGIESLTFNIIEAWDKPTDLNDLAELQFRWCKMRFESSPQHQRRELQTPSGRLTEW